MKQPHPDDELLSASLDGQAEADAATHIAGCPSCQARRAALDGVRQAVRAMPPPPGVDVTERAVAAALAAWSGEQSSGVVVALPEQRARRRIPAWALGAAAAVAALVVAVPLVSGNSNGGDSEQTASAPAGENDNRAAADAGAAVLDGGDLGEQSDQIALGQILQGAVAAPAPSTAAAASPEAATGGEAPAADEKGLDDTTTFASSSPCAGAVRSAFGRGLGPLIYSASLHWQGTPAVVLAYRLEDISATGPDHRAFVMALDGCRLLVVQGF
jgi:hypothetical protein